MVSFCFIISVQSLRFIHRQGSTFTVSPRSFLLIEEKNKAIVSEMALN